MRTPQLRSGPAQQYLVLWHATTTRFWGGLELNGIVHRARLAESGAASLVNIRFKFVAMVAKKSNASG